MDQRNNDAKNFAIGILSTTAVMLFVGLAVISTRPEPALAVGMANSGGNYEMTVGSIDTDVEEVVYVIDAPKQRLIAYKFNPTSGTIEILQGFDLTKLRKDGGKNRGQPSQRGRRRRP